MPILYTFIMHKNKKIYKIILFQCYLTACRVTLSMAFEVAIKLNITSGVNLQETSQSLQLMTSLLSKKTFEFQIISDKGYRTTVHAFAGPFF
jgi:hypothetical protein